MEYNVILSFRVSQSMADALDSEADKLDIARQVLLRKIADNWLKQKDLFHIVYGEV
jgi:hypothetical protein